MLDRFGVVVDGSAAHAVSLVHDASIRHGGFVLEVDPAQIAVRAGTTEGIWAGVVWLEREMALRAAPILALGTVERMPVWEVQIGQSPVGANYLVPDLAPAYLADDAFRMLAHFGVNGMTIYGDWLCYVRSDRFPELNSPDYEHNIAMLKDAARRAMRYGVRFYYVLVSPKLPADHPLFRRLPTTRGSRLGGGLTSDGRALHCLCSSDQESLAFQGEVLANLFGAVPELGGLNLIVGVESFYHCRTQPDLGGAPAGARTNCPQCAGLRPEEAVNHLLRHVGAVVHAVKPKAWVTAWPYSGEVWSSDPDQLELARGLPRDVPLLSHIDKDHWLQKDGYQKLIWDYSIDFTGPSDYIGKQAAIVRARGMPLFVKTETALGLECIQYPYVPCLQRMAEKWATVRSLGPVGVLQSWMFFGMWGSRAEELGWWANWRPELAAEDVPARIARRDFGEAAPRIVEAWQKLSEAVAHIPYMPVYFKGPEFIGPAHPLFFEPNAPIPPVFTAVLYYLQELEETFSPAVLRDEARQSLVINRLPGLDAPYGHIATYNLKVDNGRDPWELVLEEYDTLIGLTAEALRIYEGVEPPDDPVCAELLREECLLVELIYRTFVTTAHTFRFLRERESGAAAGCVAGNNGMLELARLERENTRAARRIFVEAPWLDLARRIDGEFPSSLAMIDAKLALLEHALANEETSA